MEGRQWLWKINDWWSKGSVAYWDSTEPQQAVLSYGQIWRTELKSDHQNVNSFGCLGRTKSFHFIMAVPLCKWETVKEHQSGFFGKPERSWPTCTVRSRLPEKYARKLIILHLSYAMIYLVPFGGTVIIYTNLAKLTLDNVSKTL